MDQGSGKGREFDIDGFVLEPSHPFHAEHLKLNEYLEEGRGYEYAYDLDSNHFETGREMASLEIEARTRILRAALERWRSMFGPGRDLQDPIIQMHALVDRLLRAKIPTDRELILSLMGSRMVAR